MNRRAFLRAGGVGLSVAAAGCTGLFQTTSSRAPPLVENRPNSIYIPTHVEGMKMIGMGATGRRKVGVMYSYAHRFWTVNGSNREQVEIGKNDAIHLMATVFDGQTKTVLPADSGVQFTIEKDGETVDSRSPWPMLSQNMGYHFGDNVPLDGDGTYTIDVDVGPITFDRFGDFAGAFEQAGTVSVDFDYREADREDIPYKLLDDEKGQHGAVPAMDMEMPISFAPKESELPGTVLGSGMGGDLRFFATGVERDGKSYLAVSPRTRFNGYAVPMMSLSATVERGGQTAFDGQLHTALDPTLGYHYAAPIDGISGDESVTVSVDTPPQVSRHEGYETAFFDVPDVTLK